MKLVWLAAGAAALVWPLVAAQTFYRIAKARAELEKALRWQGFRVQEMKLRWFTRGPFPDMRLPGTKHATERLFRVVALDPAGETRLGWLRWRPRSLWQGEERWAVRWDEGDTRVGGVSSWTFAAILLVSACVVFGLIYLVASNVHRAR